jgi:hypothetical protein
VSYGWTQIDRWFTAFEEARFGDERERTRLFYEGRTLALKPQARAVEPEPQPAQAAVPEGSIVDAYRAWRRGQKVSA